MTGGDEREIIKSMKRAPASPSGRNRSSIPREIEDELYRYLASPLRFSRFATFCNQNVALFGAPGTRIRKRYQNKKDRIRRLLIADVGSFIDELRSRGLIELAGETEEYSEEFVASHLEEEAQEKARSRITNSVQQTTAEGSKETSATVEAFEVESKMASRRASALPGRYGKYFVVWL